MKLTEFKKTNGITNEILLKDGRILLTTRNGFEYFVVSLKGEVSEVTQQYYDKVKRNRVSRKGK